MEGTKLMSNSGYVMASKLVVENKLPVKFMYREKSDNEQDSGWRFFSGLESQEYLDDFNNTVICDIYTVLDIDKTILPYLDSVYGIAFEREDNAGPFKIIKDFTFSVSTEDKK